MAVTVGVVGAIRLLPLSRWFGRPGTIAEYAGAAIGVVVIPVFALLGIDAVLAKLGVGPFLSPLARLGIGAVIVFAVARVSLEPFWTDHELPHPRRLAASATVALILVPGLVIALIGQINGDGRTLAQRPTVSHLDVVVLRADAPPAGDHTTRLGGWQIDTWTGQVKGDRIVWAGGREPAPGREAGADRVLILLPPAADNDAPAPLDGAGRPRRAARDAHVRPPRPPGRPAARGLAHATVGTDRPRRRRPAARRPPRRQDDVRGEARPARGDPITDRRRGPRARGRPPADPALRHARAGPAPARRRGALPHRLDLDVRGRPEAPSALRAAGRRGRAPERLQPPGVRQPCPGARRCPEPRLRPRHAHAAGRRGRRRPDLSRLLVVPARQPGPFGQRRVLRPGLQHRRRHLLRPPVRLGGRHRRAPRARPRRPARRGQLRPARRRRPLHVARAPASLGAHRSTALRARRRPRRPAAGLLGPRHTRVLPDRLRQGVLPAERGPDAAEHGRAAGRPARRSPPVGGRHRRGLRGDLRRPASHPPRRRRARRLERLAGSMGHRQLRRGHLLRLGPAAAVPRLPRSLSAAIVREHRGRLPRRPVRDRPEPDLPHARSSRSAAPPAAVCSPSATRTRRARGPASTSPGPTTGTTAATGRATRGRRSWPISAALGSSPRSRAAVRR